MSLTLAAHEFQLSIDAGLISDPRLGTIGDRVWRDADNNGRFDSNETGVAGVLVELWSTGFDRMPGGGDDRVVSSTMTDHDGFYLFTGLAADRYFVRFPHVTTRQFTLPNASGVQDQFDSDVDPATGATAAFFLPPGADDLTWDAGLVSTPANPPPVVEFTGRVWDDQNRDGLRNPGEPWLNGWDVQLLSGGTVIATSRTRIQDLNGDGFIDPDTEHGWYMLDSLVGGEFTIRQVVMPTWIQTYPADDGDWTVTGAIGQTVEGNDFGNTRSGTVYGRKWHDLNRNGIADPDEPGLNGWIIELRDQNGRVVASAITHDADLDGDGVIDPFRERGLYSLTAPSGTYEITERIQSGWEQTSGSVDSLALLAWQLDGEFRFARTSSLFENWGGLGEKWIYGSGLWYFITPDGRLFRWNQSPRDQLSGEPIAVLSPAFHANLSLVYDAVKPELETVTIVAGTGDPEINIADALLERARQLDNELRLENTGNLFRNLGGLGEIWIYGRGNWYFITPEGQMFLWDGSSAENLTGTLTATLSPEFHSDPSLIYNPRQPGAGVTPDSTGNSINFGNARIPGITGRKWHDRNADGVRDADEPGLNGWTIQLVDTAGNVIGQTATSDRDLNGDGVIDPFTESGWYAFHRVAFGDYMVREIPQLGWHSSQPAAAPVADAAYRLDQALQFAATASDFEDWGGLGEKWFYGAAGWYYITPDGSVFQWNGSPQTALSGTLVGRLSPEFHADPARLYNAPVPPGHQISVTNSPIDNVDFGNFIVDGSSGNGNVTVTVTNGNLMIRGDSRDNAIVLYTSNRQDIVVQGLGATTVNGSTAPFIAFRGTGAIPGHLQSRSGNGDDQLSILNVMMGGDLSVSSGGGIDTVMASGLNVGGSVAIQGNAHDNVVSLSDSMIAGHMTIVSGGGADEVEIDSVSVAGNLSVNTGNGHDLVSLARSTIQGAVAMLTGAGSDWTLITNSQLLGNTRLNTSAGHDLVVLDSTQAGQPLTIVTGGGHDSVATIGTNEFAAPLTLDGGSGNDAVQSDAQTAFAVIPVVRRFESDQIPDLDSLIDSAVTHLLSVGLV